MLADDHHPLAGLDPGDADALAAFAAQLDRAQPGGEGFAAGFRRVGRQGGAVELDHVDAAHARARVLEQCARGHQRRLLALAVEHVDRHELARRQSVRGLRHVDLARRAEVAGGEERRDAGQPGRDRLGPRRHVDQHRLAGADLGQHLAGQRDLDPHRVDVAQLEQHRGRPDQHAHLGVAAADAAGDRGPDLRPRHGLLDLGEAGPDLVHAGRRLVGAGFDRRQLRLLGLQLQAGDQLLRRQLARAPNLGGQLRHPGPGGRRGRFFQPHGGLGLALSLAQLAGVEAHEQLPAADGLAALDVDRDHRGLDLRPHRDLAFGADDAADPLFERERAGAGEHGLDRGCARPGLAGLLGVAGEPGHGSQATDDSEHPHGRAYTRLNAVRAA